MFHWPFSSERVLKARRNRTMVNNNIFARDYCMPRFVKHKETWKIYCSQLDCTNTTRNINTSIFFNHSLHLGKTAWLKSTTISTLTNAKRQGFLMRLRVGKVQKSSRRQFVRLFFNLVLFLRLEVNFWKAYTTKISMLEWFIFSFFLPFNPRRI